MDYRCLQDREKIERCLRKNVYLNIYSIGDLDDFFWPYTTWYGFESGGDISSIALLYAGSSLPTLVAFSTEQSETTANLLSSIGPVLPKCFYAHLSAGLTNALAATHLLEAKGEHYKMALTDNSRLAGMDFSGVERVSQDHLSAIQELYRESYPENWFDPRMLATGKFYGVWQQNRLVSIAGVHVYSRRYRVAALGNITTLPAYRGKGLGTKVAARLCRSLIEEDIDIGLNVRTDNRAAIACYQKIGFQTVASYGEYLAAPML